MKKIVSLLLILVLAFSATALVACGDGPDGDATEVEIGANIVGYGIAWLEQTIEEFNEMQDDYIVKISPKSSNTFDAKAHQDLEAGTTEHDIYFCSTPHWEKYSYAGNIYNISEVYDAPFNDNYTIGEALEGTANAISNYIGDVPEEYGGPGYYCMQAGLTTSSFILNRTVSNFYEEKSDWSNRVKKIDDVETVSDLNKWVAEIMRLSEIHPFTKQGQPVGTYLDGTSYSGSGPSVYGFTYAGGYMSSYWGSIIKTWWAQRDGIESFRSTLEFADKNVFSSPGRRAALEAFDSLNLNKTSVTGSNAMSHIESQNAFLAGKSALIPNGDWIYYESINNAQAWGTQIEMIRLPAVDDAIETNIQYTGHGTFFCVPRKDGVNYDGAIAFLSYLFSEKGADNFTATTGSLWAFDGYDGDEAYYSKFMPGGDRDGEIPTFSVQFINLINSADGHVFDLPNNINAPNYMFNVTGGVDVWCGGLDLGNLRDGIETVDDILQEQIDTANRKWDEWVRNVTLVS